MSFTFNGIRGIHVLQSYPAYSGNRDWPHSTERCLSHILFIPIWTTCCPNIILRCPKTLGQMHIIRTWNGTMPDNAFSLFPIRVGSCNYSALGIKWNQFSSRDPAYGRTLHDHCLLGKWLYIGQITLPSPVGINCGVYQKPIPFDSKCMTNAEASPGCKGGEQRNRICTMNYWGEASNARFPPPHTLPREPVYTKPEHIDSAPLVS